MTLSDLLEEYRHLLLRKIARQNHDVRTRPAQGWNTRIPSYPPAAGALLGAFVVDGEQYGLFQRELIDERRLLVTLLRRHPRGAHVLPLGRLNQPQRPTIVGRNITGPGRKQTAGAERHLFNTQALGFEFARLAIDNVFGEEAFDATERRLGVLRVSGNAEVVPQL